MTLCPGDGPLIERHSWPAFSPVHPRWGKQHIAGFTVLKQPMHLTQQRSAASKSLR